VGGNRRPYEVHEGHRLNGAAQPALSQRVRLGGRRYVHRSQSPQKALAIGVLWARHSTRQGVGTMLVTLLSARLVYALSFARAVVTTQLELSKFGHALSRWVAVRRGTRAFRLFKTYCSAKMPP